MPNDNLSITTVPANRSITNANEPTVCGPKLVGNCEDRTEVLSRNQTESPKAGPLTNLDTSESRPATGSLSVPENDSVTLSSSNNESEYSQNTPPSKAASRYVKNYQHQKSSSSKTRDNDAENYQISPPSEEATNDDAQNYQSQNSSSPSESVSRDVRDYRYRNSLLSKTGPASCTEHEGPRMVATLQKFKPFQFSGKSQSCPAESSVKGRLLRFASSRAKLSKDPGFPSHDSPDVASSAESLVAETPETLESTRLEVEDDVGESLAKNCYVYGSCDENLNVVTKLECPSIGDCLIEVVS